LPPEPLTLTFVFASPTSAPGCVCALAVPSALGGLALSVLAAEVRWPRWPRLPSSISSLTRCRHSWPICE
jgi:hypothetical protein